MADNDLREGLHAEDRKRVLDAAAAVVKAEKESRRAAKAVKENASVALSLPQFGTGTDAAAVPSEPTVREIAQVAGVGKSEVSRINQVVEVLDRYPFLSDRANRVDWSDAKLRELRGIEQQPYTETVLRLLPADEALAVLREPARAAALAVLWIRVAATVEPVGEYQQMLAALA